jgi:outer membrane protein assembly factor BamB
MHARSWSGRLAVLISVIVILGPACSSRTATSPAAPVTPSAADVTDYRGDLSRRGLMPGPGLSSAPVVLWRYEDPSALGLPPAVAAGQVLVPENMSLVALDLASGARTWDVTLGATITAPITVAHGTALTTTADNVLHAIDLATRRERWRFEGAADGAQVSVHDGTAYLGTRQQEFVGLDAATGTRRWAVGTGHSSGKNAIADGVAFVGGDGGSTLTAISLDNRKILWTFETDADRIATPAVADGTVYVAGIPSGGLAGRNTNLYALDAMSGQVIWRFAPPGDPPMASFAVGTHDVFIGIDSAPGTLYAVDRATGKVHWQAEIDGAVDRPALVGDVVYIAAGPGGLDAFDVTTGQALWEAPVDGYSEGVVLTDGVALVATRDAPDAPGTITAFVAQSDPRAPGQ